jgi:hypothetical protein
MADSRDITGKNRKFTGTGGIKLPTGTEAQRVLQTVQTHPQEHIQLLFKVHNIYHLHQPVVQTLVYHQA